jgi:hypothetical protein
VSLGDGLLAGYFSFSLTKRQHRSHFAIAHRGLLGTSMKKTYEKPTLSKRQQLSRVTALIISSAR